METPDRKENNAASADANSVSGGVFKRILAEVFHFIASINLTTCKADQFIL